MPVPYILSLYRNAGNSAIVKYALLEMVDNLAVSTINLRIGRWVAMTIHQAGYWNIVVEFGKTGAGLDLVTNTNHLRVHSGC